MLRDHGHPVSAGDYEPLIANRTDANGTVHRKYADIATTSAGVRTYYDVHQFTMTSSDWTTAPHDPDHVFANADKRKIQQYRPYDIPTSTPIIPLAINTDTGAFGKGLKNLLQTLHRLSLTDSEFGFTYPDWRTQRSVPDSRWLLPTVTHYWTGTLACVLLKQQLLTVRDTIQRSSVWPMTNASLIGPAPSKQLLSRFQAQSLLHPAPTSPIPAQPPSLLVTGLPHLPTNTQPIITSSFPDPNTSHTAEPTSISNAHTVHSSDGTTAEPTAGSGFGTPAASSPDLHFDWPPLRPVSTAARTLVMPVDAAVTLTPAVSHPGDVATATRPDKPSSLPPSQPSPTRTCS